MVSHVNNLSEDRKRARFGCLRVLIANIVGGYIRELSLSRGGIEGSSTRLGAEVIISYDEPVQA